MIHQLLVALATATTLAVAQGGSSPPSARVGVLGPAEPRFELIVEGLRQGLQDHGYRDTLRIATRQVPRGDPAATREAVAGLVVLDRVQLLFVSGSELARVARETVPDLPIVFLTPGDPVASGLVDSLARPGRRMTGMTYEYPELSGKRLELLREIVPGLRRVLVLFDPGDASPRQGVAAMREAAAGLGITPVERQVVDTDTLRQALEAIGEVDGVLGVPGGRTAPHAAAIIRAAHSRRRATAFPARTGGTADALVTYGASDAMVAREAARLVDRILRGAPAGDVPVERPTRLELVLNLRTARLLGLVVPPAVLQRADRVIE